MTEKQKKVVQLLVGSAVEKALADKGGGSELMRSVQRAVGIKGPTGVIGGGTVAKLQGELIACGYGLGDARLGVLDEPTAMAVQRSLNDRLWEV